MTEGGKEGRKYGIEEGRKERTYQRITNDAVRDQERNTDVLYLKGRKGGRGRGRAGQGREREREREKGRERQRQRQRQRQRERQRQRQRGGEGEGEGEGQGEEGIKWQGRKEKRG
jgi:hypothetical protein